MTTTETIAATIAAHTPIGTRYQLVAVPGTELADACTNCGGAHHVQACPEIRAALGRFDADSTIAWLREELDDAHQHIGALVGGVDIATTWIELYIPNEHETLQRLEGMASAARTWLRREAK